MSQPSQPHQNEMLPPSQPHSIAVQHVGANPHAGYTHTAQPAYTSTFVDQQAVFREKAESYASMVGWRGRSHAADCPATDPLTHRPTAPPPRHPTTQPSTRPTIPL